jgi:hypothetical protein
MEPDAASGPADKAGDGRGDIRDQVTFLRGPVGKLDVID